MTNYIALIRKDKDSDYSVDFPDFPGCITAGTDLDDAKDMAAEALAFHIEGMVEDGQGIPIPASLETVMADKHNEGAVAFLVSTPVRKEKVVRVNVTFPSSILHRIDAAALSRHSTRSALLQEGALRLIEEESTSLLEVKG